MGLFEEIQEIICEHLKVKPDEVKPETSFIEDLGAESLDTLELVMVLEDKYNIEIPDEDAQDLETVGDVVKYVSRKTNRDLVSE